MIRAMMLGLVLTLGVQANATIFTDLAAHVGQQAIMSQVEAQGLNFKKGESATYSLDMSIIKGSMVMSVFDIVADGVWIHQDVDMSFAGKQKMEILLDPNTGETKKLIVNGKEEKLPEAGEIELIDSREETIKVPAGTFTCFYIKALTKKDNKEMQQWVNLKDVPVFGMVKSIMQSQFGPVTMELSSFKKL